MSIKIARESKNMTQVDLARALNVSRSTVAMWETGKSKPRAEQIILLASILSCTADELLGIDHSAGEGETI